MISFVNLHKNTLLYTRKLDTCCQAMRQEVMLAKFQPHASQRHLKWAEISYCTQYAVYSNKNTNYLNKSNEKHLATPFHFSYHRDKGCITKGYIQQKSKQYQKSTVHTYAKKWSWPNFSPMHRRGILNGMKLVTVYNML